MTSEHIYTVVAALLAYGLGILSILWWDQRREIRAVRRKIAKMLARPNDHENPNNGEDP